MASKPNRAAYCIEQTVNGIKNKLSKLLMVTLSEHLRPDMEKRSAEETTIYDSVRAALSSCDIDWQRVLTFHSGFPASYVNLQMSRGSMTSEEETVVMNHRPLRSPIGPITIVATGELFYNGEWKEVEEVKAIALLYFAVRYELDTWLKQFIGIQPWDDNAISKICAVSPNFRASLVNDGLSLRKIEPVRITVYKHGPRGITFTPMEPSLARALQVAANLPNKEDTPF